MTTMTAIPGTTAFHGLRFAPAVRPTRRNATPARGAGPAAADLRRAMGTAAGMAARFGLALLPVSALAGMFVWL